MDTDPTDGRDGREVDAFRGSEPAGGGPRRVLLVDDEPGAADLAATHVERLVDGVETVTRTSPAEALAVVTDDRVDCVVSDYNMPGTDGLELLEEVRSIDPGLPFVLFTGRGSEEIASEAISAGVTDYLQKGVGRDRYEMLANSVENALDRRRAERDLGEINAKVTAIHEFATEVSAAENAGEVFERVVDAAEGILEFDRCVTARRRGDRLVPAARSANVGEDEIRTFALGEGVVGTTAADERTIVVDNLSVDPADPDDLEDPNDFGDPNDLEDPKSPERSDPGRTDRGRGVDTGREGAGRGSADENSPTDAEELADPVADNIRSAISVPIGSYGVFQAVSDGYAAFDDGDVEFAELLAAHAADALEQLETENALRAERDRLSALFEDLPVPVVRTASAEGGERRLDATNQAFEETFGFSEAKHGYREIHNAIIPENEGLIDAGTVLEDGEPIRREVRRQTADGIRDFILNVIPVSRSDETIVYNVYADIGEQKRIERTLRRLHETTREMFCGGDREEIAALAARAAVDILGFPNSGVRLYDPDAEALLPTAITEEATAAIGDRPAFGPGDGRLWEAFESGEPIVVDDLDAVDTVIGYGDLRSLLVVPLGDHGVMPLGSREPGFFDDTATQLARVLGANVTVALDHAQRTAQLRDRDAELQREIERLEKFAGLVSHDLRNPLNVAAGRLELAQTVVDDGDALDELDRIADAHDRMEELIDDLLALARQGRTVDELETVSLADAAARAWRTVDTEGATLDPPEESLTVEADPERLRTLLENLFINSIEHATDSTADPGDVTVSVGALPDGFSVVDDGIGFDIDPEEAAEYGTSSNPRGTGFGLAIVREIAAAHGWEFGVTDEDGARFEFRTDG
ncbi:histidine kinase [Halorubrum saccharovorum]|uniref:histidine kinase n=2 Tax=Halorubrum TaxID=56688 RepID=A0A0F8AXH4_9EURY|nr:GAF domain-containing protein [Halorubrum saccharovorum]KKF39265.1 histidine kinase [Halorubrum saccharovorum]